MASKVEGSKLQCLVCPMCLDVLKNATLLSCGHTFCKQCLEAYDGQYEDLDHIVCPLCRKTTKLGQRRIAGLTSNFLALGIQDELDVVVPSPSFCSLHSKVHNDLFCKVCKKFICFNCYLDNHKDHLVKKKEDLEEDLKQERDSLIQKGETRKGEIEKCLNNADQQRIYIHCHLSKLEKEIREEFAQKVTILHENEEVLLSKVDSIRKNSDKQVESFVANHRELIDSITISITPLTGNTSRIVNSDNLKVHYLQCSNLEKSLEKIIDEDSIVHLKQSAESAQFFPADKTLLSLGHIEVEAKETTSNTQRAQHVKTAAGGFEKVRRLQPSSKVVGVPALVENTSNVLNIVRKVDAPGTIWGISAPSQDYVVVGYGVSRHGADCFSVSGEEKQLLKGEVGQVFDIAFITDGSSVVSRSYVSCWRDTCSVYNTQGTYSPGMTYTCKRGQYILRLCSDENDNIYAVNGDPEIYIFHGSNPNPHTIVHTGIEPRQICVTNTGVMITCSCDYTRSTVTVFDMEGHVGSSITASDDNEYMYAAVDSVDRVLVARMLEGSDVFRLTRYTLQGTTLIKQMTFKAIKLPHQCQIMWAWSCLASLSPNMLAFANTNNLYFIEIGV